MGNCQNSQQLLCHRLPSPSLRTCGQPRISTPTVATAARAEITCSHNSNKTNNSKNGNNNRNRNNKNNNTTAIIVTIRRIVVILLVRIILQ